MPPLAYLLIAAAAILLRKTMKPVTPAGDPPVDDPPIDDPPVDPEKERLRKQNERLKRRVANQRTKIVRETQADPPAPTPKTGE